MFKKIFTNTLAQVFSKAWTALISILLLSALTNYLSQELFWLYSKVYNYLWIFAFLADLWLYTITIREITANKDNSSKIVSNVMTLRCILGLCIIFLSLIIAYLLPWYNSKIELVWIFIVSIFTFFSLINSSVLALMQANLKMEFSLFSAIFWKLITLSWIMLVIYIFFEKVNVVNFEIPFYLILVSGLFWIIINTLLNFFYSKKIIKFWFDFDKEYIKHIFKISIPYWLALFLWVIYFKVDVVLLSLLEPKWKADLSIALYSLPMKIVEVLMIVWWFYLNSILWELTKSFEKNNIERIKEVVSVSFKILFSFSIFLLVLWTIFKDHIIWIVANQSYINAVPYSSSSVFPLVLLVVVFYFISNLFIYILISSKNQSKLLKINVIVAIFNIIWNILIIPKYSFMWSAIITVLSQFLLLVIGFFVTKKISNFKFPIKYILLNLVFWIFIFFIWNFLLYKFSFWLILDLIVFWFFLNILYSFFFYLIYKLKI